MSSIQFGGLVSGLNTQSIIDALMGVEKQPLTRLQAKEADLTAQKGAYGQLGSAIDNLITQLKAFTTSSAGASRSASSANTSIFTASASPNAAVGQYRVSVDRLASTTKATSTATLTAGLDGTVDTSVTLDKATLAGPISAGQMSFVVDGTTVSVPVGAPASTTVQSVIDGLVSALQTQLQATDGSATVNASIVGGHLRVSISGGTAPHSVSFGGPGDTSGAATAFGLDTQSVSGAMNPTITGSSWLPALSALNLAGSLSGGQISAIVDGAIVHYTVGDPSTTNLQTMLDGFASALQTQLRAGGPNAAADPGATVGVTVVGNRLQVAVSGGTGAHSLSFGAAGDTSNALALLGIANQSAVATVNPTLTGDSNLGVVRTLSSLDTAGLSGLASTKSGVLTINGVDIAYDTTTDSLTTVIDRINNSSAGVVASLDRTNDRLTLTRKDTGALAIDIEDTSGTIAAALQLGPGTTNAQTIGQTSQVTVDGRVVTSTSNTVSSAIDGVTLNLLSESAPGTTTTLTVGVDQNAITNSLNNFIGAFNSLGDTLDKLTASTPGQAGGTAGSSGPLASDSTALTMFLQLRDLVLQAVDSSSVNSLGALGVSTGALGAAVGSTTRLQLDGSKLTAALNSDPTKVASLLDGSTGPLGNLLARLKTYDDPDTSSTTTYVKSHQSGLDTEISSLHSQESDMQSRIDAYQAALEAKYAALEATLAQLQAQSAQVSSQVGSMTGSSSSGS